MEYTVIYTKNGSISYCTCKRQYSIKEFGGFCEKCWVKLSAKERAAIKGTELPTIQIEPIVIKYKPSFLMLLWIIAVTTAVCYLFYVNGATDHLGSIPSNVQNFFHHWTRKWF